MDSKDKSPFNLDSQHLNVDDKIIIAFEKIAEVMRHFQWEYAKKHKISPIQLQILIFTKYHSNDKCTVSYLANEFHITKATISDSIKTLVTKKYVKKINNSADTRSFHLELTPIGDAITDQIKDYTETIKEPVLGLQNDKKEVLLDSLLSLIFTFTNKGIINTQRMCFTCRHYRGDNVSSHFCNLLQEKIDIKYLRIDCKEHQTTDG